MSRFNKWEMLSQKSLGLEERLERFLILYELGAWHDEKTRLQMHEEHVNSISIMRPPKEHLPANNKKAAE